MNKSDLIDRISKAFQTESVPNRERILYEHAYTGDPELESIKIFFGNRVWTSISPDDVLHFRHALSFFSIDALVYYVPAFLAGSLMDEATVDTAIEDLISRLSKSDAHLWTEEQRLIICEWLDYFRSSLPKDFIEKAAANFGCENK